MICMDTHQHHYAPILTPYLHDYTNSYKFIRPYWPYKTWSCTKATPAVQLQSQHCTVGERTSYMHTLLHGCNLASHQMMRQNVAKESKVKTFRFERHQEPSVPITTPTYFRTSEGMKHTSFPMHWILVTKVLYFQAQIASKVPWCLLDFISPQW